MLPTLFAETEVTPRWDARGVGAYKIRKKNIKLFKNHKVKIDIIEFILLHSILQIPNKQAHKQTRLRGIKKGTTEMLLLPLFSIYIALVSLRRTSTALWKLC